MGRAAVADWDAYEDEFFDWDAHTANSKQKLRGAAATQSANSSWTVERVETLTKLWNEGFYASEIGKVLGITRNAVIGKANRLKLTARDPLLFRRVVKQRKGRKLKSIGRRKGTPGHERTAQKNRRRPTRGS